MLVFGTSGLGEHVPVLSAGLALEIKKVAINTPLDIARLSLISGGLLLLALGPRTADWNWVALLAVCTGGAVGWAQTNYGPPSSTPDKIVPRAILVAGVACIGIRVWLALG